MYILTTSIIIWVNSYHKSKRDWPIKWNSLIQFYHTYAIVRGRSFLVGFGFVRTLRLFLFIISYI